MKISKLCVVALFFVLSGCANVGNKSLEGLTEAQVRSTIAVDKTTMDEIRALYGSPLKTSFTDSGLPIWTYQYDDTTSFTPETVGSVILTLGLAGSKARGTRNELVVLFDDKNVVRNFSMSNSPIEAGTGVF